MKAGYFFNCLAAFKTIYLCCFFYRIPVNTKVYFQWFEDHETEPKETPDPQKEAAFSAKWSTSSWIKEPACYTRLQRTSKASCQSVIPQWDPHSGSPLHVWHTGGRHSQNSGPSKCYWGPHRQRQRVWRPGTKQVHPSQREWRHWRWIFLSACCCRGWNLYSWSAS